MSTGLSDLQHPSIETPFKAALGFVELVMLTKMLFFLLQIFFQNSLLGSSTDLFFSAFVKNKTLPQVLSMNKLLLASIYEKENASTGSKHE